MQVAQRNIHVKFECQGQDLSQGQDPMYFTVFLNCRMVFCWNLFLSGRFALDPREF